jgi:hypothetical protein
MWKTKNEKFILLSLLALSLVFHIVFGLFSHYRIIHLENQLFLCEIEISSLERRNALYEGINDFLGRQLEEYKKGTLN